jgi:hypothetical protein
MESDNRGGNKMLRGRGKCKLKRFFSLATTLTLILNTLLVGISLQTPNIRAGSVGHTNGDLEISWLTDYGRIMTPISWVKPQTAADPSTGLGFIGLVIDQDNYNHPPGIVEIADSFSPPPPYTFMDDFIAMGLEFIGDNETLKKSKGYFQNTNPETGDPNDIYIEQTCWTVTNKDWALLQWKLNNLKSSPITGACIGLELPISQVGTHFGLGGESTDGGDEIDGFDPVNGTYWAQDTGGNGSGITIGFASAVVSDPITHYYAEDYHAEYQNESAPDDPNPKYHRNFYANETWLYERLRASNSTATDGVTPGNITATVGWNDFTIPVGSSRIVTLVIAVNDTSGGTRATINKTAYDNMIAAIEDARYYYHNIATGFHITEFSDSGSAIQQIEIFNFGRSETDLIDFSFSTKGGPLTGNWNKPTIQSYEHAVFTVTGGTIGPEGDTINLHHSLEGLIDAVSFGQEGVAPDPLAAESVGRRYGVEYTNEWVRNASTGPTWDLQNDVGSVISSPQLVLNSVMFNPKDPVEGYVELMYKGASPLDISDYRIICNDEFIVPQGTILDSDNRFYILIQSVSPIFFANMDAIGDNVYLYDHDGNLLDMVGWSSPHNQGEFMSRIPDGNGTFQGYDDATSEAAGWVFGQLPNLLITEFYVDSVSAQIEVYNPRGGDKVLDAYWTFSVDGGQLTGAWSPVIILGGGYSVFTMTSGIPGDEGDTIGLYYSDPTLIDEVSFGTNGVAPDPLSGESTSRYWDDSISGYNDDWTREDSPTFGAQNDVPPINKTPFVVLNEVMFNPMIVPDGLYVVIINKDPFRAVNISNFYLVCDDVYQLPSYPMAPGGFDGRLFPNWRMIIKYGDDAPASDAFFAGMTSSGDNVYLYDPAGHLLDMVGWNTSHLPGMCVRRVPDGNGTFQGYNDPTSEAAGWVFNSPLQVLITEVSDMGSTPSQIELYNPWYPMIDFLSAGFTLSSSLGPLVGTWSIQTADTGEYGVFDVDVLTPLEYEGDTITLNQNSFLVEEISYGLKGTVPDPLAGESVQRYWDGISYTEVWERNLTTGPNFGAQNDVPPANFSSAVLLNEIMFYPMAPSDYFVEIYNRGTTPVDISGYRIVCDRDYVIPEGTILDFNNRFFYLLYAMNPVFFDEPVGVTYLGDNVYLYDENGRLLDMVGWSSSHEQGKTMRREPDGNGTRDGYDDESSIAAGWVFGSGPSPQPTPPPPTGVIAKLTESNVNVTLTWNASSDDGGGENDVAGYTVYKSNTGVNGSYEFTDWIPASGSANYNWTDVGAGDGDWNDYFYLVRANDTLNVEEQNLNKVGKFVNYLVEDWNLFSVPLIQSDSSMEHVLQTVKGNYLVLQGFHAGKSRPWLHWHRDKPNKFNDAIEINHKNGYYIDMVIPDHLVVAGAVPTNTQISLKAGWNLVGYPCLIEKTRDVALSSIAGKYNKVEYYDTSIDKEVRLGPDDPMQPGLGYWIHATEDCTLIV